MVAPLAPPFHNAFLLLAFHPVGGSVSADELVLLFSIPSLLASRVSGGLEDTGGMKIVAEPPAREAGKNAGCRQDRGYGGSEV